jgi:basic membrane protein A
MKQKIGFLIILGIIFVLVVAACQPAATEAPITQSAPATTEAPATLAAPATTEAPATLAAPATTEAPATLAAPAEKEMMVALLLPGSINDAGWNASAYKGLKEIEAMGIKTAYTESVPLSDMEAAFRGYAEQGYTLIIGHGFEFSDAALKVAPEFPNTYFYVSGKAPPSVTIPKNLSYIDQQEFQGAYLCGMLAGLMTKSNKIGFVGGPGIPPQIANSGAYFDGARSVNPNIEIFGAFTGTFEDPEKGREAALAQIKNGADIIMQTADSTGMGVIQVATEEKVWIIGYGSDQKDLAPNLVMTSLTVDIPKSIVMQIDRIKNGTFGGLWVAGIKEGIIDIAPFGPMVPEDIAKQVMAARDDIISGKLVVKELSVRIDQK